MFAAPRWLPLLLVLVPGAMGHAAEAPVKLTAVEPIATDFNLEPRLLKKEVPARFHVTLENRTAVPQRGTLAAEVVGNLDTIYGLAAQALELAPNEKRTLTLAWRYPVGATYEVPSGPVTVPGAAWGHELNVAWQDADGRIVARGQTVFVIERDGSADKLAHELGRASNVTPAQAFALRYSGYLANPAFAPLEKTTDLALTLRDTQVASWKSGTAPSGHVAYLAKLGPVSNPVAAALTMKHPAHRLRRAWVLDPNGTEGPRARRLFVHAEQQEFTFTLPPTGRDAVLVLELERAHFVAPANLADVATRGAKQFGPVRDFLKAPDGQVLTTPEQWTVRRKQLRDGIRKGLGSPLDVEPVALEPRIISEEMVPAQAHLGGLAHGYIRRKVSLRVGTDERMNVWLLVPPGIGPFPAIIACHQTVAEGKDEPIGLGGNHGQLGFGPFLVSRGFVVIAPDSYAAGERIRGDHAYDTRAEQARDPNWSILGKRLFDHQRTIDYLETLPFVDRTRIGVIGHSLGGESAAMLAALDERIAAAVVSCPFTLLRTLPNAADVYTAADSGILPANLRPLLQKPIKERTLPFDFDDCMALWAPRPVFFHGVHDDLWPNAPQVAQACMALRPLYRLHGAEARLQVVYSAQAHCFPGWVQPDAFDLLESALMPAPLR